MHADSIARAKIEMSAKIWRASSRTETIPVASIATSVHIYIHNYVCETIPVSSTANVCSCIHTLHVVRCLVECASSHKECSLSVLV